MGSRAAPGRPEEPSIPSPMRGITGTSHCGAELTPGERAGQRGELEELQHAPQGPAGTQGTPCSSGASHQGDVLVTDTSVLCSSVCRK